MAELLPILFGVWKIAPAIWSATRWCVLMPAVICGGEPTRLGNLVLGWTDRPLKIGHSASSSDRQTVVTMLVGRFLVTDALSSDHVAGKCMFFIPCEAKRNEVKPIQSWPQLSFSVVHKRSSRQARPEGDPIHLYICKDQ